jgi:hypothetical protein
MRANSVESGGFSGRRVALGSRLHQPRAMTPAEGVTAEPVLGANRPVGQGAMRGRIPLRRETSPGTGGRLTRPAGLAGTLKAFAAGALA